MYYILFGIILIVQLIFMAINNGEKHLQNMVYWILSTVIFLIAALRYNIGYDTIAYNNSFNLIHDSGKTIFELTKYYNMEIGYVILCKMCNSFETFLIIVAMLGVIIKVIIIKTYSDDIWISLLMYYSGVFLNFDMGVIRQGISISILFICIKYIRERKALKFYILILIGSLMHISTLVFIPLYYLNYKKLSRLQLYSISIVSFVLSLCNSKEVILNLANIIPIDMIASKLNYYATIYALDLSSGLTLSLIKRIVILVIFVEFYKKKKIDDTNSLIFLNGYLLSIVLMGVFSSIDILGGRGSIGLYLLQIFIFAKIIRMTKSIPIKFLVICLVCLLSLNSMMDIINYGNSSGQPYSPYKSILSY